MTVEVPLSLPFGPCWELQEQFVDSTTFLHALPAAFPGATHLFVEGTSIEADVVAIYSRHYDSSKYMPKAQTLWSTGTITQFSCAFSDALCNALAEASQFHAEPELFDHIFIYAGQDVLMEWPDAFHNTMWISKLVPEERVSSFAAALGLQYK